MAFRLCTWLGHWELRGYGMYTWVEKDDRHRGRPRRALVPVRMAADRGGLDARPLLTGRGYATEAGRGRSPWRGTDLVAEWVCSVIHPDNERSQAVAEGWAAAWVEHRTVRGFPADIWRYDRQVA